MDVQDATLAYRGVETSELALTERTIAALWTIRRWALLFAVALLLIAAGTGGLGLVLVVVIIVNWYVAGFDEVAAGVMCAGNMMIAPFALVCGVRLIGFVRAIGKALVQRDPNALERAHVHLARFWRAAVIGLILLMVFPVMVMILAVWTGAWN